VLVNGKIVGDGEAFSEKLASDSKCTSLPKAVCGYKPREPVERLRLQLSSNPEWTFTLYREIFSTKKLR